MIIQSSAPGSLMLFGEHSVLRRKHALITSIEKRIYVTLTSRQDEKVFIKSSLGNYEGHIKNIIVKPPFHFILQILKEMPLHLGFTIVIESEIPHTLGLGSSASLVIALLGALYQLQDRELPHTKIHQKALYHVRKIQGEASGADLAASLWGGTLLYRKDPFLAQGINFDIPLFAAYSGSKTPTAKVIKYVSEKFANQQDTLSHLDALNDSLTLNALTALTSPEKMGELFMQSYELMEDYGLHTQKLRNFLHVLKKKSYGVKLSGSGLGDCAIGVIKDEMLPKGSFKINKSEQGLRVKKNVSTH